MLVILATDGSPSADDARDLLARLPLETNRIVVLQVLTPLDIPDVATPKTREFLVDAASSRAMAGLRDSAERLSAAGRTVEAKVVFGRPATMILREARKRNAQLIVVGSRGRGPIRTALLGSVAAAVIGNAPCPVLIVRGKRGGLHRVMLADDGSRAAASAAAAVRMIASGAQVTVAAVQPDSPILASGIAPSMLAAVRKAHAEQRKAERATLKRFVDGTVARFRLAGWEANPALRRGDPAAAILALAQEEDADLIATGTRGRGRTPFGLGSVARNILTHARCSVLVVPAPD